MSGAEHATVQRLDLAPVVWAVSVDVCHFGRVRLGEHVFHITDQRVLRQRAVAQPPPDRRRQPPHGAGHVQLLADDAQAGAGDLLRAAGGRVTFSSRSSCLTMPRRASRMNEFSCAGSRSVHGAWRARKRNVRNAIGAADDADAAAPARAVAADARRRTTDTARSTDTRGRPASARAGTRADTAARPARARSPRATARDRTTPAAKRQRHAVGAQKCRLRSPRSRPSRDARLAEPIDRIDADDFVGVFGERQRHAAAAASGVEHAAARSSRRRARETR